MIGIIAHEFDPAYMGVLSILCSCSRDAKTTSYLHFATTSLLLMEMPRVSFSAYHNVCSQPDIS